MLEPKHNLTPDERDELRRETGSWGADEKPEWVQFLLDDLEAKDAEIDRLKDELESRAKGSGE